VAISTIDCPVCSAETSVPPRGLLRGFQLILTMPVMRRNEPLNCTDAIDAFRDPGDGNSRIA
jgi:hypothetical protein